MVSLFDALVLIALSPVLLVTTLVQDLLTFVWYVLATCGSR